MFEVTRYEHPEIFVTSRRTGETYRFSVRNDRTLAYSGTTSEQREAWRAAVAHLARIWRPYAA
jgi:hypothetical protein